MKINDYTKQQIISLLEVIGVEFNKLQSKTNLFNLLKSNEKKLEEIRLGNIKPIENRTPIELDQVNIDNENDPHHVSIGYFDRDNNNLPGFIDITQGISRIYKEDGSYVNLTIPYRFYTKHRDLDINGNVVNLTLSDLYPYLQFNYWSGGPRAVNLAHTLFVQNNSSRQVTDIRISDVPLTAKLDLNTMELKPDLDNLGSVSLTKISYRRNSSVIGYGCFLLPYKFQSNPILEIYTGLDKISIKLDTFNEFKGGSIGKVVFNDSTFDKESKSVLSTDISPELIRCPELKCICPEFKDENKEDGTTFDDEIDLDDKFCGRLNPTYPRDRKKQIDKVVTRGESFVGADTVRRRDGSWEQCPPHDIQTYTEQKFDDDGSFLQRTNFAPVDDDGNYDWYKCHPKDCIDATPLKYNTPESMEKEIENKRNLIDELIAIRSKGNPNERKMPFEDELARRRGGRVTGESFETALAKRQSKHRL